MNCDYCTNYLSELDTCKYCSFESDDEKIRNQIHKANHFNIFELNDDEEWSHIQILNHLHNQGIECLFVDIWTNDNIAWIIGCTSPIEHIARALGIHKECIYPDWDHGMIILNLFQEKYLRGMLE